MEYAYPTYQKDFTKEALEECCRIAVRLVSEEGIVVKHEKFLDAIRKKPGVSIDGVRVRFEKSAVDATLERWIAQTRERLLESAADGGGSDEDSWSIESSGSSIAVRDVETDEVRPATQEDLRRLIRLVDSYGATGLYPVTPQDLPPLMRTVACFKICYESSENIRPYDYLHIRQTPFIYEMHRLMGKRFTVTLVVPQAMRIDENDIEVFMSFYGRWKEGADINFQVLDYPMLGLTKPVTSTGCFAMNLTNTLAAHHLFKAFDEAIDLSISGGVGQPVDFRSACWAWGHPRMHLYHWLGSRALPVLCGVDRGQYRLGAAHLQSSSAGQDFQAGMERMATCLMDALLGARRFRGAGVLCVDDIYSAVQFVLDVETVRYVRELIEAFDPHPDIFATEGLYEACRDVIRGDDEFLSHPHTSARFRNILPSNGLIRREKLRSWLAHRTLLVDRAREEAIERMKRPQTFRLPDDKQKELDRIYREAEAALSE